MNLCELVPGRLYHVTWERQYPCRDGEDPAGEGRYIHRSWHPQVCRHVLTPADGGPDIELHPEDIKDVY